MENVGTSGVTSVVDDHHLSTARIRMKSTRRSLLSVGSPEFQDCSSADKPLEIRKGHPRCDGWLLQPSGDEAGAPFPLERPVGLIGGRKSELVHIVAQRENALL